MSLALPPPSADSFLAGLILPPPEIKSIVDKTAAFVAKNPKPELFEDKIRLREKSDSRFAFLNKTDAYHPYYQHRLAAFRAGEVVQSKTAATGGTEEVVQVEAQKSGPVEPPVYEFLVQDPPLINPADLDILRLTALFTARSGRQFISELSSREARNYQFDFLRPSHSLFGYFNRLVEQYTKVLIPSKELFGTLERRSGAGAGEGDPATEGRREVLKDARLRADWERFQSSKQKERDDAAEAERIAFAEIDWQDFVVVSTVEFTEGDEAGLVELPPPMSISEVENMTIAQRKMAAMIMEGREDEVAENERERLEAELALEDGETGTEQETVLQTAGRVEREKKKATEIKTADSTGPMKIRKDYIPKANRPAQATQAYTNVDGQQVRVEDFSEHMRINLLDPRWVETKRINEANRSGSNLLPGGTDVSASLRALASHRADIFGAGVDSESRKKAEVALRAQQKEREKNVWDGHTNTAELTSERFLSNANMEEQIAAIHRAKGLVGSEESQEPKIGPAYGTNSATFEPAFLSGATYSAAPQPHQTNYSLPIYSAASGGYGQPIGTAAPDYTTAEYTDTPGLKAPTAMAGLPARPMVSQPGEDLPALPSGSMTAGIGRPAEEDLGEEPVAKKQRVMKRGDGSYYPEQDWLNSHPNPISLTVQLPLVEDKSAWGCDGTQIVLENIPLTLMVGTLRDRISAKIGLPVGKQRLSYGGSLLSMSITLASLNVEQGDTIVLAIKDGKKK